MHRRHFLTGLTLAAIGPSANAGTVERDGVTFVYRHKGDRLHATLTAPTDGWVAAGFNNKQQLQGTRFVIGALNDGQLRIEEHIATVPDHPRVQDLGLATALADTHGEATATGTMLRFSLPHDFSDSANPTLRPGTPTYLMLAWSHETDFTHHSAWRRHYAIML